LSRHSSGCSVGSRLGTVGSKANRFGRSLIPDRSDPAHQADRPDVRRRRKRLDTSTDSGLLVLRILRSPVPAWVARLD
jgi:hypothetical protein